MKFYTGVTRERIPSFPVLYMRRTGAYGQENHALMETFKQWIRENGLEPDGIYAMALDNPAATAPGECRYDVCIRQPRNREPDLSRVSSRVLPGGWYAVFVIPHTADGVQKAWLECFPELERLGYRLDCSRPVMERYQPHLVDAHLCELCLPVLEGSGGPLL